LPSGRTTAGPALGRICRTKTPPLPAPVVPSITTAPLEASVARREARLNAMYALCGTELGGTPSAAKPRQPVTTCPSLVRVAATIPAAPATGPPQTSGWSVQLTPLAGAVKVLMPPFDVAEEWSPDANRRSVPSGIASRASPPAPPQPVATVLVPVLTPLGENRVS